MDENGYYNDCFCIAFFFVVVLSVYMESNIFGEVSFCLLLSVGVTSLSFDWLLSHNTVENQPRPFFRILPFITVKKPNTSKHIHAHIGTSTESILALLLNYCFKEKPETVIIQLYPINITHRLDMYLQPSIQNDSKQVSAHR